MPTGTAATAHPSQARCPLSGETISVKLELETQPSGRKLLVRGFGSRLRSGHCRAFCCTRQVYGSGDTQRVCVRQIRSSTSPQQTNGTLRPTPPKAHVFPPGSVTE